MTEYHCTTANNDNIANDSYQQLKDDSDDANDHLEHQRSGTEAGVEPDGSGCQWQFTDFGVVGETSRDGSIHSTDEVFNSSSHLAALMMSILGSVLLISEASAKGHPWKIAAFSIYGLSLVSLFAASSVHHAITTTPEWEEWFQKLDYLAIFPLIAGTLTPLCLVYLHDSAIGWSFFAVVWTLALVGMFITARWFQKVPKWFTMTMYITLGWLCAFVVFALGPQLTGGGLTLMIVGGVIYTIGGYVYTTEQPNPLPGRFGFHEIWHVAVMLGAACHWCMMYFYVLPWNGAV